MTKSLSNIIKSTQVNVSSNEKYNIEVPNIHNSDFFIEEEILNSTDENINNLTAESTIQFAKDKSEVIISQAQKVAEQIITQANNDARIEAQKIKEIARKEGYDFGYNSALGEINPIKIQIQHELETAIIEKEETLKAIEPKVVRMVLQISKSIFGKALKTDPQTIVLLMKKGLAEANATGKVFIHISKYDYEVAQQNISKLSEFAGNNSELEILKDLSLDEGDCIIETSFGNVDCSFEQQFESIKNELLYILENR